jgi:hypothetical protein
MTVHAAGREFRRRSKREPKSCQSWRVVVIPFHPDRGRFFAHCYNAAMVRPDRIASLSRCDSCCIGLAGESPVAVSAGAPRSRHRAKREISASEWCVKSLPSVARPAAKEASLRAQHQVNLAAPRHMPPKGRGWPSRSSHGEGNRLHPVIPEGCRTPPGYGGGHANTAQYGTGETRPGGHVRRRRSL